MFTNQYHQQNLTTEQFAEALHGKPSTIRTRLYKTCSFYGIKPIKLPSGRLLWLAADVQTFLSGRGLNYGASKKYRCPNQTSVFSDATLWLHQPL